MTKEALKGPARSGMAKEMQNKLFGPGNAFDGAQEIIARAKAAGTWHDSDAKKEHKGYFRLKRAKTKERIAILERRIGASGDPKTAVVRAPRGTPRPVFCEANGQQYPDIKAAAEATFALTKGVKDVASLRVGIAICLKSDKPRATGGVVYRSPS